MIPHDDQVILFPHEDNCIQGIFHMPPWPNFPPWPCLDSELPSNTELSLLCHNDESGRTLRLRTTCLNPHVSFGEGLRARQPFRTWRTASPAAPFPRTIGCPFHWSETPEAENDFNMFQLEHHLCLVRFG